MENTLFFVLYYQDTLNQLPQNTQYHFHLVYLKFYVSGYLFKIWFHGKVKVETYYDRTI